jgi:peptidoglycan/LPS O-acetylase OafA/YrhL
LASFIGGTNDQLVYYVYKVQSEIPGSTPEVPPYFIYPILALTGLSAVLSFLAIFTFKNRRMQMKLVRGSVVLILIMIAVFFFYAAPLLEKASGVPYAEYEIGAYMPLVAFIFLILAYRGIQADEKLIRSADRLR